MEGFHSWAADEVKQFEEYHKIGTKRGSRANSDTGDKFVSDMNEIPIIEDRSNGSHDGLL